MQNAIPRTKTWMVAMLGGLGVAVVALALGGRWLYRAEERAVRAEKHRELEAIAELKSGQLAAWRQERLADCRLHSQRTFFCAFVRRRLSSSAGASETSETEEVKRQLQAICTAYGYENAIIASRGGEILAALDPQLERLEAPTRACVAQSVTSGEPVGGDFFRCSRCGQVHLDVTAPIPGAEGQPAGALVLRCNPETFLYPVVQSWPTPSRTAETLLVRKDGDSVLFLNRLRHRPDPPLTRRTPLSETDVPAVRAARGESGFFEGPDYRGVPVLAEVVAVAGSPWFLVAKVDVDEALAEARHRGKYILTFVLSAVLLTGALGAAVFGHWQRGMYQSLYRAEKLRRLADSEIRGTFYSIGDGVISADAAGRVKRMNPAAEKLTGWSEPEAAGRPLGEVLRVIDEETRAEVEDPIRRVMQAGVPAAAGQHAVLVSRYGCERPVRTTGAPILGDGGQAVGAVVVFHDRSEQRHAEALLRQSEGRYRMLVENTRDVFLRILPDAMLDYCSPVVTAFGGYTAEEEVGQPIGKYFADPGHLERAIHMLAEVFETQESRSHEFLYKPKTGDPFWVEVTGQPVIEKGEVTAVHCVMRDISQRKQAEEALRESREQFRTVVHVALDAIVMCDAQGRISLWNRSAERMFGYSAAEAMGQNLHKLLAPVRLHEAHARGFAEYVRTGSGPAVGKVLELPALHKDGHEFPVELSLAPVRLAGEWHAVAVVRDVSERKRAQEELERRAAALESANRALEESSQAAQAATRAKGLFLANMSHEIRTPLTAILGYADLLADDALAATDRRTYLATVRRNAEHLLQLINDILDLSKIEAGKMVMEPGPCQLPSLIADVASMMRPRAEQRRNTLQVRYDGPVPETICTDQARLRQVLVNLVGNAVKFTEQGSVQILVSFVRQWRSGQPAVRVAVADSGIGISEETLPRLFESFVQGEIATTRRYGGTGLGLAISRRIVAALGGELSVESTLGKGSTFTVTVPAGDISGVKMLPSPDEAICEGEAAARWVPGPEALRGVKILLAEDSPDNQNLLRTILGKAGGELEVVDNGRLAVERALETPFDVVLMDMNMPEMDGYEAARMLRRRGYARPILALTANAMSGDGERCLAAGCDAHLPKPIDRRQLIETVQRYASGKTRGPEAPAGAREPAKPPAAEHRILSSEFAGDPQLAEILPQFVEGLPGQLHALLDALNQDRLEDAERIAHRLKGAGGGYGYPALSEAAAALEAAVKSFDAAATAEAMGKVQEVCAAIQAGWDGPGAEPPADVA